MIKIILKLGLIVVIGAAVYYTWVIDAPITWETTQISNELKRKKCIGSDGRTYYGKLPAGVTCAQ